MKKILIVFVLCFVFLSVSVDAAETYYVDATNGNDAWSGNYQTPQGSPPTDGPWETWDKVRGQTYSAGDHIKFKRGGTFDVSSTWWFSHSGNAENYIVIEDYGSGDKPIWNAMDDVVGVAGDWTEETVIGNNIWSRSLSGSSKRTFVGDYESAEATAAANIDGSTYLWYHDGNRLYVYSTQNPADEYASIKVMTLSTLFAFNGASYVKLQNIRLQGGRTITINGDCSHLDILYNDIWYWGEFAIFAYVGGGSGNAHDYINVEYNDIDAKRNLIDKSITEMENRGLEDCIRMYNAQNNWNIRHNIFRDGGHALILMYNQAMTESGIHNNLVEYNEFYGQNSTYVRAWGIQGGEGGVTNNTFRYNWIEKVNVRSQLGGNNNEYYYNIFYDTQQSPVTTKTDISQVVNFPGFGSTVNHDNKFYNNVIYKAYNTGIWFVDSGNDPYNTVVKNNIIMETGEGGNYPNTGLLYDSSITTTQTIENNCFYDADMSDVIFHKGTTYTVDEANSGLSEYSDNIFQDPLFVDAANGNFRLQLTSPCIDNGTYVGLTLDFEGNSVPQGNGTDTGAYEYQSGGGFCGDGNCSSGETCSSCPQDCKCPTDCTCMSPQICCSGQCVSPACFNESDCGSDPCKDYTCSNPGNCSASCSSQDITSCINDDGCCPSGCDGNDNDCVVPDGPVALYHFDENSGTNAADSSGNGNDGTVYGATWTTGISGYALDFDGVDDYVDLGDSASLRISEDFTITAWIYPTNVTSGMYFTILSKGWGDYWFTLMTWDGDTRLQFQATDITPFATEFGSISANQWYFVALRHDGNNYSLWIDGDMKSSIIDADDLVTSSNKCEIGEHSPDRNRDYFNGTIDEVRIYNRTLTQEEILELYNNPGGEQIPGDLNNDGHVDILDLGVIAANFGKTSGYEPGADVVPNSEIDVFDLVYVASRFT